MKHIGIIQDQQTRYEVTTPVGTLYTPAHTNALAYARAAAKCGVGMKHIKIVQIIEHSTILSPAEWQAAKKRPAKAKAKAA